MWKRGRRGGGWVVGTKPSLFEFGPYDEKPSVATLAQIYIEENKSPDFGLSNHMVRFGNNTSPH